MRRFIVCVGSLLIVAGCDQGGGFGSPTGPTSSGSQSSTLSGRVTESGASSVYPIAGAVLTIADGTNAGNTATTNAAGQYSFSQLRRETFSVTISATGYVTSSFTVDLSAGSTRDFALPLPVPRTPFGSGQFLVGEQIVAGRYFTDPPQSGCYWERQKGLSGTFADIIANKFVTYDGMQYIIDILPSDVAFKTDPKCGTWHDSPRHEPQASIRPGVWLVGSQIVPGTYEVSAGAGCYWERLRHFQYQGLSGVITNSFSATAKTQVVTIEDKDVGFGTDTNCGTWTRTAGAAAAADQSLADIERNHVLYERSLRTHR